MNSIQIVLLINLIHACHQCVTVRCGETWEEKVKAAVVVKLKSHTGDDENQCTKVAAIAVVDAHRYGENGVKQDLVRQRPGGPNALNPNVGPALL